MNILPRGTVVTIQGKKFRLRADTKVRLYTREELEGYEISSPEKRLNVSTLHGVEVLSSRDYFVSEGKVVPPKDAPEEYNELLRRRQGYTTYYIPLLPENCTAVKAGMRQHIIDVGYFVTWLSDLEEEDKDPYSLSQLRPHGLSLSDTPYVEVRKIFARAMIIAGVRFDSQKEIEESLEKIRNKPPEAFGGLSELTRLPSSDIDWVCGGAWDADIPCVPGIIAAFTPGGELAGYILYHYIEKEYNDVKKPSVTDVKSYATIIGITATVPYLLARQLQPNLPTVSSLLIPYVIGKTSALGRRYIFVPPLRHMAIILHERYAFVPTGRTSNRYIYNLGVCGTILTVGTDETHVLDLDTIP